MGFCHTIYKDGCQEYDCLANCSNGELTVHGVCITEEELCQEVDYVDRNYHTEVHEACEDSHCLAILCIGIYFMQIVQDVRVAAHHSETKNETAYIDSN